MPFQWLININSTPAIAPGIKFDPNPLNNVGTGDQVVWANNDGRAHWPGLVKADGTIDTTFFMPNQIAPHSTSVTFSPANPGTLHYACSLPGHEGEKGSIQVVQV